MSIARRLVVNPANTDQRYVLWSNGYIEAKGSAVPITSYVPASVNTDNGTSPVTFEGWASPDPAVALQITNWTTPAGYVLTIYGHVWHFGGAPAVPGATNPLNPGVVHFLTGQQEFLLGMSGGFSAPTFGYVIDFLMNPAADGTGYFLKYNGEVIGFGTGVTAVPRVAAIPDTAARMLLMDWTSKRWWVLDNLGRLSAYNGASQTNVGGPSSGFYGAATYPAFVWGRGGKFGQGGARIFDFTAGAPRGWVLDAFGRAYRIGASTEPLGFPYDPNSPKQIYVDLAIISDGTSTPLRLAALTSSGAMPEWVVSTAPSVFVAGPVFSSTNTTSTRPAIRWVYTDNENNPQVSYQVKVIDSSVYAGGGTVNEVQSLNQTGAPTGGSVKLAFRRDATAPYAQTASIAFNASAATVQAALEALPNIGTGGVACAGGPWGTAAISVTFQNQMGRWDWPQITLDTNAFTGGASPTIAISTTTAGVGIDPNTATALISGTGTDPSARSFTPLSDLPNGTLRAYVRATDNSALTSAWSFTTWTQNVTTMSTPTVTPTVLGGLSGISLALSVATGGLDPLAVFAVQYHDSDWDGSTWEWVRGGDAKAIVAGAATLVDLEARFGVLRSYRTAIYVFDATTGDWRQSPWSATTTATLTPRNVWALTNPFNSAQGAIVRVQPGFKLSRKIRSGKFWPSGAYYPTVITDGQPKAAESDLGLWALTNAERVAVEAMVNSDVPLLLRDPFGRSWYVRLEDSFDEEIVRAAPLAAEATGIRDMHTIEFHVQQIKRPVAGPSAGPLAEAA